jgi:hypothetical protein
MPASELKKGTIAHYLNHLIDISGLTHKKIALALGYEKAPIVSMFKMGLTKVPLDKVPALAKVLGLDPKHLMIMALKEYQPEVWATIQDTLGYVVTDHEYDLIQEVRKATDSKDPEFTKSQLAKVRAALH